MNDSLLRMKEKIWDEMMEDLDHHEGMKLKPKAVVSVTAVKPHEEMEIGEGEEHDGPGGDEIPPGHDDLHADLNDGDEQPGEDDDDLKMLLQHYMGK